MILYNIAEENENNNLLNQFENLRWLPPVNSTHGFITIIKNFIEIITYASKEGCNKKWADEVLDYTVKPWVKELRSEYDLVIAGILMVLFSYMKEHKCTDKHMLMDLSGEILENFITKLEEVQHTLTSKIEYQEDESLVSYVKKHFRTGMVIKNYKILCTTLNQEIKNGKSRTLQLKEFKRYFDWEKDGQKFIITDIYDTPLPKDDLRKKGNNSIYKSYIELILLQYLSTKEGYTKTFTKRNWLELLGMINSKYGKEPNDKLKKIDRCINNQEINLFYVRTNRKLEQVLYTALKGLENEKLIIVEFQTVIVFKDNKGKEHRFIADDRQKRIILQIERDILTNVMGYSNMFQICIRNKLKEYYRLVNEKLYELYEWNYYYKQIKIIYDQENIIDAIPSKEIILQKQILNNKIIEFLNDNAKKIYEKKEKEYDETLESYLSNWIGDMDYLKRKIKIPNMWRFPNTYIEAQRILTEELIRIGHNNIDFLPDKLLTAAEESNEFLAWMF